MSVEAPTMTLVEQYGGRWQVRYFDLDMELWFDYGDPRPTKAEAEALRDAYLAEFADGPCCSGAAAGAPDHEPGCPGDPGYGYDDGPNS